MKQVRGLAVLIGLALAALGAGPQEKPEILVFGAASLTESLQDLGKAWEAKTGRPVTFSFGASSDLARQIQAGAPADVFFSADTAKMDALEKAGLVHAEDRRELLSNILVVIVPASSKRQIRSPQDLGRLPRLAVGDPDSVPVGIYAKKWLEGLGLWEKIRPILVPTLDARSTLAAVDSDAVTAGIVYRTDAAVAKSARVAFEVSDGPEIAYAVAPLAASANRKAAEEFVRFLAGEEGRAEFRRRGFRIRGAK